MKEKDALLGALLVFLLSFFNINSSYAIHSKRVVSTARRLGSYISAPVRQRSTLLFIIDGCRADVLYGMIESGDLPHMRREVFEKGIIAENAITTIPSTTFTAISTILTGLDPGRTGIVGNKWFNPVTAKTRSYLNLNSFYSVRDDTGATTIFQLLAPIETAAIFAPLNRGASFSITMDYNYIGMGNYILGRWSYVDRVYVQQLDDVVAYADKAGVFPQLTVLHLPSTDYIAHEYGYSSEEYREILKNLDDLLGEVVGLFEQNGVREKISILVTADHGQVEVGDRKHFDIGSALKKMGFKSSNVLSLSRLHKDKGIRRWLKRKRKEDGYSYEKREKRFRKYNAVYVVNGRCSYVYLRDSAGEEWKHPRDLPPWPERPDIDDLRAYSASPRKKIDIIESFVQAEGIGFVLCKSNEGVEVFSKRGHSRVEKDDSIGSAKFKYTVISGGDPLYYNEDADSEILDGRFYSEDDWAEKTSKTRYPGVVGQIVSLMSNERCGDLLLFAEEEWDFEPDKINRSGHGGFTRDEMRVPFLWSGPDIQNGRIGTIRSVDIFPTIAEYLGIDEKKLGSISIDGESFLDEILSP